MAKSNEAGTRVKDLTSWSTSALKRRLQLDIDMCKALLALGCRGLHRRLLRLDVNMINRVLRKRKTNEA